MRILTLLVLSIAPFCVGAPVLPPLFYAVVSDTQKPADDPLDGLKDAVQEVNQMKPTFVLMPGDLTDTGKEAQYENVTKVIRTFQPPVYAMVGNHEGVSGEKAYRGRYEKYFGEKTYSHRVIGGWHLIRLDSVLFHDGKLAHEGGVDAEQLTWLKNTLATIPRDAPILISQHHPLRFAAPQTANEEELLALFSDHYLVYTVTGHKHWNELYQDYDAVQHIVTGAVAFSCRPKEVGTGYRLISTVGRDLWTTWVDLKEPVPMAELHVLADSWLPPTATKAKQVLLRIRYSGGGELTFRAKPETALPAAGESSVSASATGDALRIRLPQAMEEATAVVPLPKACLTGLLTTGGQMAASDGLELGQVALWEGTAEWQHLTLKCPGETNLKVSILSPRPGAKLPRGKVPVVAMVEGKPPQTPVMEIGGQTGQPSAEYVSVLFQANGLQSKSHGFRNCVYVNDEYLTDIEPNRDVLKWEWFAFPTPADAWRKAETPQFRLTAGTPDDGSGANPPANNEDYQARSLVLLDGTKYLSDPTLPVGKVLPLGDNGKNPRTLVDCKPTTPFEPRRWRATLQVVDTSTLKLGPQKITVTWGGASAEADVEVTP